MASTSGEIIGNHVIVSGSNYAVIRIDWQLASQNTAGDYSTINWQAYVDFYGCDAELDNGTVSLGGAVRWSNGGRVYNYAGNFSNHTITLGTGTFNISADASGNTTLTASGSIVVYQSGTSSTSGSWTLPTIPRYASITSFNQNATDEGIEFDWTSSDNVDYISWWSTAYDGGGHHDTPASGTGPFTINLHNLVSGKTYDITVAVRRADSGLWTNSSTVNKTTLLQNNFFLA